MGLLVLEATTPALAQGILMAVLEALQVLPEAHLLFLLVAVVEVQCPGGGGAAGSPSGAAGGSGSGGGPGGGGANGTGVGNGGTGNSGTGGNGRVDISW